MAQHRNITDLTVESVSECLDAAKLLIDHRKPDGGMMGYAATLLLFSITDAIGHHLNVGTGHTRLEVLNSPAFDLNLSGQQIYEIKRWYRNSMVHNAAIVPGVFLTPEDTGDPFVFEAGKPVAVRVPQLYKLVRSAWDNLDKTAFDPLRHTVGTSAPPPGTAPVVAESGAVSGIAVLPTSLRVASADIMGTGTTPSSGMPVVQPGQVEQ